MNSSKEVVSGAVYPCEFPQQKKAIHAILRFFRDGTVKIICPQLEENGNCLKLKKACPVQINPGQPQTDHNTTPDIPLPDSLKRLERDELLRALIEQKGSLTKASSELRIDIRTLNHRMRKHEIDPSEYTSPGEDSTSYVYDLLGKLVQDAVIKEGGLEDVLESGESYLIKKALKDNKGHLGNTSKSLGITLRALKYKIKKYQIQK